jgi:erythromycin esterase
VQKSNWAALYPSIRTLIFLLILATLNTDTKAQNTLKEYVQGKVTPIKSIDPEEINCDDLESLGFAIGDANVVMLGEQAHGDAATFLAKTRLIKYLHEKKGFNVLAFESDFFGLNDGWDRLLKNDSLIKSFTSKNIYYLWTQCNTCSNLFYDYIPSTYKTNSPLTLTGFDNGLFLNYSLKNLKNRLDSLAQSKNLPITKQLNYRSDILPQIEASLQWPYNPPRSVATVTRCLENLKLIKDELGHKVSDSDFWMRVLDNLIQQVQWVKYRFDNGKEDINARDLQMAKNLTWLIENKYKGQKIIVWAASMHIARSAKNIKDSLVRTEDPMGGHIVNSISKKNRVYILGFTSYQGFSGRIGQEPYPVHISNQNSFEGWVNAKGYKYAFVDFTKFNLTHPSFNELFFMAPLGHEIIEGDWNRVFDGVIYIRDMYPCKEINP